MIFPIRAATITVTNMQVMSYTVIAIALVLLLALKEVTTSENDSKRFRSFIEGSNVAIIPLLLLFAVIVIMLTYEVIITPS